MSSFQMKTDLRSLTEYEILDALAKKEYRPVAVALITDSLNRILLVQSSKNPDDWGLPQGGIEPGEDLADALFREIREETGIEGYRLEIVRYIGSRDLDAESGRRDKRGFTKGKRYFAVALSYSGPETLALNSSELAGYRWAERDEVVEAMASTRAEKRGLILDFMGRS